jgi:hypothetical protein
MEEYNIPLKAESNILIATAINCQHFSQIVAPLNLI